MRACEHSRSPLAYGQTKCVCMTLVFLHSTAIRVYAQARYALGLHQFTDLLYNGFKLPKQQQLWGILRFHLFFEELPSGFCLQFHVRDAWRWNISLLAIIAIS